MRGPGAYILSKNSPANFRMCFKVDWSLEAQTVIFDEFWTSELSMKLTVFGKKIVDYSSTNSVALIGAVVSDCIY